MKKRYQTNPRIPTGPIENAVPSRKTNPTEPTTSRNKPTIRTRNPSTGLRPRRPSLVSAGETPAATGRGQRSWVGGITRIDSERVQIADSLPYSERRVRGTCLNVQRYEDNFAPGTYRRADALRC